MSALTHRERIRKALAEHRTAWDLESDAPQDWLDQVEADLVEHLARKTYPTELVKELRHVMLLLDPWLRSGELEIPGLATLNGAKAALALYEETP